MEDGEEVIDPENTSAVLNMVLNTINKDFEHECLDEAVSLLKANPICQSPGDRVPGRKDSIPGLPGTKCFAHQVWAIWFIVRRWVWEADMPGALVADEMSHGKTSTSVAAATLCKLVTKKVVMGLPLSMLWGNTQEWWVILVCNDFHGIIGEEQEWCPLQRFNSVPSRMLEIQSTPPHRHPALLTALEPLHVVKCPEWLIPSKVILTR
jgi:hypothetical protein